jgi:hypothetical protein
MKKIMDLAKSYGYMRVDITESPDKIKKVVRIANNEALCKILTWLGIDHERAKTKDIVDKQIAGSIPDYEISIVVDNKHVNYHNKGFQLGMKGIDFPNQVNLIKAVEFLTKER